MCLLGEEIMLYWIIIYLFEISSARAEWVFKPHEIANTFMIHALIRSETSVKEKYTVGPQSWGREYAT